MYAGLGECGDGMDDRAAERAQQRHAERRANQHRYGAPVGAATVVPDANVLPGCGARAAIVVLARALVPSLAVAVTAISVPLAPEVTRRSTVASDSVTVRERTDDPSYFNTSRASRSVRSQSRCRAAVRASPLKRCAAGSSALERPAITRETIASATAASASVAPHWLRAFTQA